MSCLIVGLGNPGAEYEETRHNVGYKVVGAFASKWGWSFKLRSELEGRLAQGVVGSTRVFLVLPVTFMNRSGFSVKACLDLFKVPLDRVLVVSDDVALPLGELRLRSQGSAGGHNGLKSIEEHLGTQYYARLRMGVGGPKTQILSDYVLDAFSSEEKRTVEESTQKALGVLDSWVTQGCASAMQLANAKQKISPADEKGKKKEEGEEENG